MAGTVTILSGITSQTSVVYPPVGSKLKKRRWAPHLHSLWSMAHLPNYVFMDHGSDAWSVLWLNEGGPVRSTVGTRRRRVFTTSWVVCAGSSTTARSPSATARWESPPKFSSPRCLIYNNLPVSCLILPGWAKKVRPQTHGHNSVQS